MCSPSAPSAPSSSTSVAELPEWAKPYAKESLAKAAALTDVNQNPYQTYGGERIAGLQPLQQKAFDTTAGLDAGPQAFGQQIGQYMSPYMQNVVDIEKREAARQSGIMGTQQQAQATQAGAFGGGRDAIMRAERERNLAQQMGDIQARGSQAAFEQGANQFRQGITQQAGLAQLQGTMGAQQQQQAQRPLDVAYQDFLNQQNYPYKQLGFMSDIIRGLPLGQKSTATVYDQGPGLAQTLGGLGMGAYGLSKAFAKDGGLMSAYADGGMTEGNMVFDNEPVIRYAGGGVTSPQNIESILPKLSDQQLAQAKEAALNRRDTIEAQMIDAELAERASIRGGLGGAFNQIPQDQQEQMMAGGGIVAFAKGGDTYGQKFEQSLQSLQDLAKQQPEPLTPEQYEQGVVSRQPMIEKLYGPDVTQQYAEEIKAKRAGLSQQMDKDTGLAIAMAGAKLLAGKGTNQQNKLVQGLSDAGEAFAGQVMQLRKANNEADDKLRQSEMLIATAQQQRKEGMVNKAMALEDKAEAQKQEAFKTKMGVQEKVAQLQSGMAGHEMQAQTQRDTTAMHVAGQIKAAQIAAAHPTDLDKQADAIYAAKVAQDPSIASNPKLSAQAKAEARQDAASQLKVGADVRANVAQQTLNEKIREKAEASVDNMLSIGNSAMRAQYRQMQAEDKKNNTNTAQAFREGLVLDQIKRVGQGNAPDSGTQQPPPPSVNTGMPSRGGPQPAPAAIPPQAVDILKKNPSAQNIQYFDQTFGQGAAARVLGK